MCSCIAIFELNFECDDAGVLVYSHCECHSVPLSGSSANCLYLHSVDLMEKVHMRPLLSPHSELMIFGPLVGRWRTYWKNNNCFVCVFVGVWVCVDGQMAICATVLPSAEMSR